MRDRATAGSAAGSSQHHQHHQHNKVQRVYSLDVEALSDRLGLSQQELVDGIAKDHSHVALQDVLESAALHARSDSDADSDSNDDNDNIEICRHACLLLPSPPPRPTCSASSTDSKNERFALLERRDDGRTDLEHILHELFQPRLVTHVVVCVSAALHATAARATIETITNRLGARANVRVTLVDADAADSETRTLERAVECLAAASPYSSSRNHSSRNHSSRNRSDGLLVLRCDRVFDAPTIRMMAMRITPSETEATAAVRVRALMDLDVDGDTNSDNNNATSSPPFAGIFALMGDATATLDLLARACRRDAQPQLQLLSVPQSSGSLRALVERLAASDGDAVVEKVVASDYCRWHDDASSRDSRAPTVAYQSLHDPLNVSSYSSKTAITHRHKADRDDDQHEPQHYVEFPRESHLLASRGYQGYQVTTTLAPAPLQRQHVGQQTSEHAPLLDARRSSSSSSSDSDSDDSEASATGRATDATTTTTLTDADVDALLDGKSRAFLFQIGPDALPSSANEQRSVEAPTCCESGVYLALPDVTDSFEPVPNSPLRRPHVTHDIEWRDAPKPLRQRRRSQLPSAVQTITLEAVVQPPVSVGRHHHHHHRSQPSTATVTVAVKVVVKTQVPAVGYAILGTALVAISSQGAAQDLLVGVPPLLKVFWRMTGASLAFAPFALRAIAVRNWQLPTLATRKQVLFAICGVAYSIYNATFLVALSLTSVGHTYIFSNCHSLLLVLAKVALGQPLGALELVGAAVGFSGGVLTTLDRSVLSKGPSIATSTPTTLRHGPSTLGDMVALAGAFAGVAYLLTAKRVRPTMDVFVFMWALVTTVAVLDLVVLLLWRHDLGLVGVSATDATHGLAGWLHHVGIETYVVLVGSFCGTMGFVTALRYFDPLVVSVTMLLEPAVATAIGILLGVDQVPGPLTLVGGLAVLAGCALVLVASHRKTTRVDVSDALEAPTAAAVGSSSTYARATRRRHSTAVHHLQQSQSQTQQTQQRSFRVTYGSFP